MTCCKDCPKSGCGTYHDQCPIYQAECAANEAIKAKKRADTDCNEFRRAGKDRAMAKIRRRSYINTHGEE